MISPGIELGTSRTEVRALTNCATLAPVRGFLATFSLPPSSPLGPWGAEGDVTREDSQHSLQHCFEWLQHYSNIATLCCAKTLRCKLSGATAPLSNDDGDGSENGKKATGLNLQNNNFARASRFFVHFSAATARLRRETS